MCFDVCLLARSTSNERSRLTQIISTNVHKLTQNGNLLVSLYAKYLTQFFICVNSLILFQKEAGLRPLSGFLGHPQKAFWFKLDLTSSYKLESNGGLA